MIKESINKNGLRIKETWIRDWRGYDFLVFLCGNVYNKCVSVREWILMEMAILAIRGRQRVYGWLHTAVSPKRKEY